MKIFPWIKCITFSPVVYVFTFVSIVLTFTLTICFVWNIKKRERFLCYGIKHREVCYKTMRYPSFLTNFNVFWDHNYSQYFYIYWMFWNKSWVFKEKIEMKLGLIYGLDCFNFDTDVLFFNVKDKKKVFYSIK